MMDPSMISGAIAFVEALDRRIGADTTARKRTDVPGHTRELGNRRDVLARRAILREHVLLWCCRYMI